MVKGQYARRDRLVKERRNDAYKDKRKESGPAMCQKCKAVYTDGKWSWAKPEDAYDRTICPACRRIEDKFPAGEIEIRGLFYTAHEKEVMNLIRNREKMELNQHPLERIMDVGNRDDCVLITTTGVHLARQIGESLAHSYQGDLHFTYGDAEKSIRVRWER